MCGQVNMWVGGQVSVWPGECVTSECMGVRVWVADHVSM